MTNYHYMTNPTISIIAVIGKNRELGKNNKLLWNIPQDLKRFKEITSGHPVIMGKTTYQSIGRPLPGRSNIIISRDKSLKVVGCTVVDSIAEAISFASINDKKEVFIIGGGQIYQQGIKFAVKLYLTVVDENADADTFFPEYSDFKKEIFRQENQAEELKYTFLELLR